MRRFLKAIKPDTEVSVAAWVAVISASAVVLANIADAPFNLAANIVEGISQNPTAVAALTAFLGGAAVFDVTMGMHAGIKKCLSEDRTSALTRRESCAKKALKNSFDVGLMTGIPVSIGLGIAFAVNEDFLNYFVNLCVRLAQSARASDTKYILKIVEPNALAVLNAAHGAILFKLLKTVCEFVAPNRSDYQKLTVPKNGVGCFSCCNKKAQTNGDDDADRMLNWQDPDNGQTSAGEHNIPAHWTGNQF